MTGKRYNGFDFELQSLESRTLMTAVPLTIAEVAINGGTQLRITGTNAADQIALQRTVDGLVVTNTGGFSATYTGTYVNIKIVAGNGNDSVMVDSSVTEKCIVIGGNGNDTLSGGNGNDSLFGNAGIDKLYGNDGDDVLVSVGGGNDTVTGGNGNDSFWTDNSVKESITDADMTETGEGAVHKISSFRSLAGTAVSKEITGSTTRLKDPKTTSTSFKYHSFADRPLFADNGPSIDDIKQGQVGDCYFLATIASIAKVDPMKIRQSICDLGDGTYAVQFTSKGASTYVRVDNDLATYNWSATTPAYANLAQNGSMWVPIMEKAFTFFRTSKGTYASISSGFMTEVYTDFGVSSSTTTPSGSPNAAAFVNSIKSLLDAGKSVTAAVYTVPAGANLVSGHAYTIDSVVDNGDGTYSVKVRNPWGMDAYSSTDGSDDGYVTLSANQAFAALAYVTSATV